MRALTTIFLLIVAVTHAQLPDGEQFYVNLPAQNPAFTGIDNFVDVQLRYRKTWSQFGSNPSIVGFSIYGKSGKAGADAYRNNSFRVSDPTVYGSRPASIVRKHGYGASVNSFSIGGYERFTGSAKYAYHIPVGSTSAISLGTSFQWLSEQFNVDDLTVRDPINDQFYQSIVTNGYGRLSSYSVSFGGAFYAPDFFIGVGAAQLIYKNVSAVALTSVKAEPQLHLVAGKTFQATTAVALQPMLRVTHDGLTGSQLGVGLRARYKEIFNAGLHYEIGQRLSYLVGINAKDKVRVYYAYDQFMNDLKDFRVGNHEVIIRVPLFNARAYNSYSW